MRVPRIPRIPRKPNTPIHPNRRKVIESKGLEKDFSDRTRVSIEESLRQYHRLGFLNKDTLMKVIESGHLLLDNIKEEYERVLDGST